VLFSAKTLLPFATELRQKFARIKPELTTQCQALALNVDDVNSTTGGWSDIQKTQGVDLNYPILVESDKRLLTSTYPMRNNALTVRSVFIVTPTRNRQQPSPTPRALSATLMKSCG